ncbi:MAG: rRNA maturation RNase YbeY [Candidatus Harrisonbacteria bacterium RIFCSPLOWO2_02_FULL_41_11]|nr:MAG: rRNA maturation RNase YbeY [Candidatus Harrisonbacteria bacterium RIFCSPLOWO2_02_FULL_41_11]
MKLKITALDKAVKEYKQSASKLSRRLASLLRKNGLIEVYLIGDGRMKSLNQKFRGKNRATNVLSFTKPKNFPGDAKLGEVYLAPEYIKKNKEDLLLMLIHGVLHILGYGHQKKSDRIKMEKKEEELLLKLPHIHG